MCWLIVRKIKLCHNDTFSHETFQKGCKHVLNSRNVFTKVQSYHTGSSLGYFVKDALYKQIYTQLEIRAFFSSTKNPNVITNVKSEMMVFYVRWYNSVGTPLEQCRDQGEVQAHVIFTFLKKQSAPLPWFLHHNLECWNLLFVSCNFDKKDLSNHTARYQFYMIIESSCSLVIFCLIHILYASRVKCRKLDWRTLVSHKRILRLQ